MSKIRVDDFMERITPDMDERESRAIELDFIAECLESGKEITPIMRMMFAESLKECSKLISEKTLA